MGALKSAPPLTIPRHPALIERQLSARLRECRPNGPFVAATLVEFRRKCGKPGRHCADGPGHPAHHLTFKEGGRTRSVHVPADLLQEVRSWVAEHKRIKTKLAHVSRLTLARIRAHTTARKRRAGRS